MLRIFAAISLFALMASAVLGGCVVPNSSMVIRESSILCPGNYSLDDGLIVGSDGMSLICNHTTIIGHDEGFGILINSRQGVIVRDCAVKNFQAGIALTGSSKTIIEGVKAFDNRIGILVSDSDRNLLESNTAYNNSQSGIILSGSEGNSLEKNTVNQSDYAVYMSSSDNNNITDNILSARLLGFYLNLKNRGNHMYSNRIYHTGFAAQTLDDTENSYCYGIEGNQYLDGAIGPSCETPAPADNLSKNVTEPVQPGSLNETAPPEKPAPPNITASQQDLSEKTVPIPPPGENESEDVLRKALMLQGLNGTGLEDELQDKLDNYRKTMERLSIRKELVSEPAVKRTIVRTEITVKGEIKDLYVYEFVPKCIAGSIDDITFLGTRPVRVLQPDPLFVWYFPSVSEGQVLNLSYEINSKVTFTPATVAVVHDKQYIINGNSTCARGLLSVPSGTCLDTTSRKLIPFLLVPLIAFLYIYFYRFQKKNRD